MQYYLASRSVDFPATYDARVWYAETLHVAAQHISGWFNRTNKHVFTAVHRDSFTLPRYTCAISNANIPASTIAVTEGNPPVGIHAKELVDYDTDHKLVIRDPR